MDDEPKETEGELHAHRSRTTKLKRYEEMLVKGMLGTSRPNEPLQAVIENKLNPIALQETNNSILERNRALLQYVATIANSNSDSDEFNYEFVQSLVTGGADINIADQYGQSIFHEVARSWDCDVAKFLLSIDCDINKQDSFGRSPLHVAAAVDYEEMTQFLLSNGADIDVRTTGENQAPIHYAAKNGATKSLRVLLGFHADINSMDCKQRTPLQLAAEWTRGKAAEVLLDEGAASCLLDSSGNTALTVLIDRLPNLALEALNQLRLTDVITMKEYFYIQFLEQSLPEKEETATSVLGDPTHVETLEKSPKNDKTTTNKKSTSAKEELQVPSWTKTPVRTPLEMAVITRKFDVVNHPVMQRLVHNKWIQYGRLSTFIDLLFHIVYGILWTTGCMSTPSTGKAIFEPFDDRLWLKIMGVILGIMTLYDILAQINATMKARKSQKDWVERRISQLADDRRYCHPRWPQEEKYIKLETKRVKSLPLLNSFGAWFYLEWIVLILIILTTATSVVYYYKDDTATRYLYTRTISIVNLLVWLRLLKYVRPFHGIGTLVIILGETVTDFLNWAFLFLLFLVPFTAAFWMNFGAISIHPVHGYKYGNQLLYSVFRMAVGDDFNREGIVEADPVMARILIALYVTAMTIVTLNLLIALLSDTFTRVYSNAVANTIMQRAIKVVNAKRFLTKKQRFKYEEHMRTNCSPEVRDIEVKERDHESEQQRAKCEIQSNLLFMNELLLERFGKVYGKNKTSDFDALFQDVKRLRNKQEDLYNDLRRIKELITMYSGNTLTFTSSRSTKRHKERKKNEDEKDKQKETKRGRGSKESSENRNKEESKGFLSSIQEKASSFFQRITGESEELAKSSSSQRERKGGRRRPRSENSDDERRERRRRRKRRRAKSEADDESKSLVQRRRHRSNRDRSEEGDSRNQSSELAIVRYEPTQRNRPEGPNNSSNS